MRTGGVHHETRMKEILGFANPICKTRTGLGVVNINSAVLLRTMRNEGSAFRGLPEAYRIFISFSMIEAAIKLSQNFAVVQQERFRALALIDHRKAAVGSCVRCVKGKSPVRARFPAGPIEMVYGTRRNPIDQGVAAPRKRSHILRRNHL